MFTESRTFFPECLDTFNGPEYMDGVGNEPDNIEAHENNMTELNYIELTLNVSLSALVQSFCGNRTESECAAAIDAAWDALDVSDLDVALEYSPSGLSMATARISGAVDSAAEEAGEIVVERFHNAIKDAFESLDCDAAEAEEIASELAAERAIDSE